MLIHSQSSRPPVHLHNMLYRNVLNGATIRTNALIRGKNWVKEEAPKEKKEEPKAKKAKKNV